MPIPVTIPLINPNEPEALLAALHVKEGSRVEAGQILAALETTKATFELAAEASGYLAGLQAAVGQTVRAGDVIGWIAEQPDWQPEPMPAPPAPAAPAKMVIPAEIRMTAPARALLEKHHIDPSRLPAGALVTEAMVRALISPDETSPQPETGQAVETGTFDPRLIVVYGGGGHGKAVIELLRSLHTHEIVGVLDDGIPAGEQVLGVPVLGGAEMLPELYKKGMRLAVNAVGGIGKLEIRLEVFRRLRQAGFSFPSSVHPTAFIEASARLSDGVQVFPLAYVGSSAEIGFGCIINTGAIVSHDCKLADTCNLSPGATLAGGVEIGEGALIGMRATINLYVKIGARARVGNGATVKGDVPANGIVPAGSLWPR